jgi:maltose alpha-D-glucosyltransferase/alpha-amylase
MRTNTRKPRKAFASDPLWYKDAVIYQLHIRAFADSNNDGIGDFKGLISKLDYLKDLGVNAVWVLPFYPSPLKDDGYDIADYEHINPSYGNLQDFKTFLNEAHARGIRVITELVINHTSDQHEWFQLSRRAEPNSYWRNFYVWSDTPDKYKGVRIIFRDFEPSNWTYDPVAKSYYWHRFFSHQPDLNFDNPHVKKKIFGLIDYWMKMGVDGLRLDAVPYLFEREGTSCENLPETHEFLKELRAHVDARYPDKMLLAEANQWPEDAVAYFGDGDECHMNFHFPIMPRLFMAVKREDRFSILDILRQTPDIPQNCQWAMFLRNHDELTLEMVTDEERDYMYSVYANDTRARINLGIRRRLAPLLGNDRRQIELLNGLLFSLPGTPIIYYGDEIGMGDNIYLGDRNGVRTPFQWSSDRNAGFSHADPQKLFLPVINTPEYHYTTVNVENQLANPSSLLRWTRNLIELRKQNTALTRGGIKFLEPDNTKVLAFIRDFEPVEGKGQAQKIMVIANLSKRAQYVEMDLSDYRGLVPVELGGDTAFPPIGDLPYFITLGPYDFYWFELTEKEHLNKAQWLLRDSRHMKHLPNPDEILQQPDLCHAFERMLVDFLPNARWFAGKGNTIRKVMVRDTVEIEPRRSGLIFIDVHYKDDKDKVDTYLLTVTVAEGERADNILRERPDLVIGEYDLGDGKKGIYHEAIVDAGFAKALMNMILKRKGKPTRHGVLDAQTYKSVPAALTRSLPEPSFLSLEQSNSSLRFGKDLFFKLFRRLEPGKNPEVEIGQRLTKANYDHTPHLVGSLDYEIGGKSYSLGVVHNFVEGSASAWDYFQDRLEDFAEDALRQKPEDAKKLLASRLDMYDVKDSDLPQWFIDETSYSASLMKTLGQRTGEVHKILGTEDMNTDFIPEEITPFYQRSLYQSLRNRATQTHAALKKEKAKLGEEQVKIVDELFDKWQVLERQFDGVRRNNFGGKRIRIHGDYHLGQILFTGKDFCILDFEGEPMRAISTRRLKHAPLVDVAGLLRSIDYAIQFHLKQRVQTPAERTKLEPWLKLWRLWMSHNFIEGYKQACAGTGLLPEKQEHLRYLMEVFVLEKALYEVGYELSSRPDWVGIPLSGIIDMLPTLSCCRDDAA